jgi:hypothetical protein
VLSGVYKKRLKLDLTTLHGRDNGRYLHKVGPRARYVDDLEH